MLLSSFFILNRTTQIHQHTFYPHVHSLSNIPNKEAVLRPISIPDALPSAIPRTVNFSLVAGKLSKASFVLYIKTMGPAGDFEEVYGNKDVGDDEPQAGLFDAILTCFFIDTVRDSYLLLIYSY